MYQDREFIFTNHRVNPMSLSSINRNIQQSATNIDITKHTINYTMCYKPHVTIIGASCVTQNEYGTRWLLQS